jgi:hypothetical protein
MKQDSTAVIKHLARDSGVAVAALLAGMPALLTAAERPLSFAHDIRPILSNSCFKCHGPDEAERKGGPKGSGGLRLDTEEGARANLGGRTAVIPGHADDSELMVRILATEEDEVMPPPKSGSPLTPAEAKLLEDWINGGAKFSKHWSYEPPAAVEPPHPDIHPIDAFVRDRLEKEGLQPQPEADRATLARRLSFDLTGLPPSPEEVDAFVSDAGPDAYGRLVDRLLASPAYGEHWGRHWLDLARYADSAGYADDPSRPIWAFRDYVIRSFNANKPFDQFTVEQIAGDLLPEPTDEQLVATAFHRNTMTNSEGGTNDEEFRSAAVVDRVNTTMAVWMGTSMACAQCHTHKYDPITQTEYFRMYAFLNNTADADLRDEAPLLSVFTEEQKAQRQKLEAGIAEVEARFKSPTPALQAAADQWAGGYPLPLEWLPLTPSALTSQAGLAMAREADGTVAVATTAEKDRYVIEFDAPAARTLSALRLEALPHESLPNQGPGHAAGNFVITGIKAEVKPPDHAKAPQVRFVRIELAGKDKLLQLAEVQVFSNGVNVAPQGTASQKSTFADAAATRANDGNTAGGYDQGSVAHTALGSEDPWWEVDLKSDHPVSRIVVWNRSEAAERLAGFRVVALDAQRQPVWEKSGNPAAAETPFGLDGSREIRFAGASADYVQPDFDESRVVSGSPAPAKPRGSQAGWAIGGAHGRAHSLVLATEGTVELPAGSKLVVTIEQQSPFASHTLGRFRLSATADPAAARLTAIPAELAGLLALPASQRDAAQRATLTDYFLREITPEMAAARTALAEFKQQLAALQPGTVPIFRELPEGKRRKTHLQIRGNYLNHGDEVTEGVPMAIFPLPEGGPRNRLTLARWLVDPANPLTARVIANRFWESLFGIGIVRTSEEFGAQGDAPSHPELLDWLALDLVRGSWDIKRFIRLIVTSGTYRQSSKLHPGAAERDPDNRLLARGPRVRLTAEMVRDQALATSGLLSPVMFGPSVRPVRPALGLSAAFGGGLDWQTSSGGDQYRRALYTEWRRTSPYPSMSTFDAPSREVCTLRRDRSNTPLQALVLLNDPVYVEAAQALARRLTAKAAPPEEVIREGFRRVLSRVPSDTELKRLLDLRQDLLADYRKDPKKASDMATVPIGPLPAGADPAELAAWTAVAGVLLNLDETLLKR